MSLRYPPKPRPGDRVAVLSPSGGLPELLPLPYETGLHRLRTDFGLVPVEYPTTRRLAATPRERAADIHAAFTDPDIRAVISSIGGDDQITVLPYLDAEVLRADPKPFFGFSDNINLLAFLWDAGIVGYHGGAVMTQFGRPGAMHPTTEASLRAALFEAGDHPLAPASEYGDVDLPWDDPASFETTPPMLPCDGWTWHNAERVVEGTTWGGNLELLGWLLMANRAIPAGERLDGGVLILETSEELPRSEEVYRILRNMGERGLLRRFDAALIGRAKAWSLSHPATPDERTEYVAAQQNAFRRAFGEYAPETMLVFDVDLGHTDPQVVIPYGGTVRVDGPGRAITVTY
ncbi:muramoyltetrapeptide carboxypeptidase LdcA involved in peptidoglycan recycling [Actinoalloteichus hoggarensis]|uniref:Microcin C7 self-immunity protein MccF n=1 Tax=Actinoalloteichus hoggarensis TaxID=1470176 RepID=A0A221VZ94_9PSEU|nr:S66 peptidase family protein [Actinoalloteichus hoggarensis]ASO18836.1 Microcin C7 self-immunity protein MccF [Actinoalloteichus hoggarensis]MBB5920071.1 muramoyltetrapeptide carboxypeptidase LdcA involved in peptidoglycan recycling [Actinoalloteichus hoggarensis]